MKVIRDPLHGHIKMDELALKLIDTPQMQRLRRIRQLGFAYLVYPGANHTRFEHSLGTYNLAGILLDQLGIENEEIRVAALLHDIGHGPYSHSTEEMIHKYTKKTHEDVFGLIKKGEIKEILDEFSLSRDKIVKRIKGISDIEILHSEIDVDRMDYLIRDAYYTGVAFGLVDYLRLIHEMDFYSGKLVVKMGGIQAVESLLVSRFLMRPTVYYHHVSRIAESMLIRALDYLIEEKRLKVSELKRMDDYELNVFIKNSEGYARETIDRINDRKLFKRALYIGQGYINTGDLNLKNVRRTEKEIAETVGIDDGYVLIDVPKSPKIEETKAKILVNGDIKPLDEISQIVKTLESAQWENWRIGVYTLKEHLSVVEKVAKEVLGVEKMHRQQTLERF